MLQPNPESDVSSSIANPLARRYRYLTVWLTILLGYGVLVAVNLVLSGHSWTFADVPWYIADSYKWREPFNTYHMQGYPLMIALLRGLTRGVFPDIALMHVLNLSALCISLVAIQRIADRFGVDARWSLVGFALFPFAGINTVASPLAEVPAMMFALVGIDLFLARRFSFGALTWGFGAVMHKGVWPFIAGLVVCALFWKELDARKKVTVVLFVTIPAALFWLGGTIAHRDVLWILRDSMAMGSDMRSYYIPFEGIFQTLREGPKGMIKGAILVGLVLVVAGIGWYYGSVPNTINQRFALALCTCSLFLFAYLTKLEIFAGVRFARLAAVAMALTTPRRAPHWLVSVIGTRIFLILTITMAMLSQFLATYYVIRVKAD